MGFWPVVKKVIRESDVILEVMDARMPGLSRNEEAERLIKFYKKPLILVFTKSDLISKSYLDYLRKKYKRGVFVSGTKNLGMRVLKERILIEAKRLGILEPGVGIIGYPNTGKSAIINALAKRAKTRVSNRAGTTRGIQWVRAGSLKILDSPGVIPWEDEESVLGILGAKNPEKLKNPESVAFRIIRLFLDNGKNKLESYYEFEVKEGMDDYDILLAIGRARGFLVKGNKVDENRTIYQIIRDWRDGKLRI